MPIQSIFRHVPAGSAAKCRYDRAHVAAPSGRPVQIRKIIPADLPDVGNLTCCHAESTLSPSPLGHGLRSAVDNQYISGLVWAERRNLLIALVCALICTCTNLAAPVIAGFLLEILAGRQPLELYPKLLGLMAVMYTIEPLLGRLYVSRALKAAESVITQVQVEVFRVLLMQPISFYDRHSTTEITNSLAVDVETVRSAVFGSISRDRGLRAVLEAVGSIVVLFYLCWRLAPVLASVIVGTAVAATVYRKVAKGIEGKLAAALSTMSRVAGQAFTNIRTVRAFAGENLERERFVEHARASYTAGLQFAHAKAWLEAANRGAIHLSLVILYSLGGWLVLNGHMPLRVMLTGIGFTFSLMFATQGMVNTLSDLRKAVSAFQRVRTLLNSTRAEPQVEAAIPPGEWWLRTRPFGRKRWSKNGTGGKHKAAAAGSWPPKSARTSPRADESSAMESEDSGTDTDTGSSLDHAQESASSANSNGGGQLSPWLPGGAEPAAGMDEEAIAYMQCPFPYRPMPDEIAMERAQGDIVARDVSFSYPMRPDVQVLRNISFRLERGKMTALVGRSGAGKSTVVSLLSRFYAPETGTITMGGMDIFAWSRNAWSSSVALVSQDPVLFAASIHDNIAYGAPRASQEIVEEAAKAANAHDFIMKFPDGYGTMVGEGNLQLSGGQRQRINIARALLKDAPVLILDEATSSLDMKSEALVSEAVSRLVKGRTVLVIAHRLSTIKRAARVIVMADGEVVEEGTPAKLIKGGGYYSDLVDSTLSLQV